MPLADLDPADREIIHQCVVALREGRFLDESSIPTRIGVPVAAYDAILARWPRVDDRDDASEACLAINNALNEVCHGVHIPAEDWPLWFTASRDGIRGVYDRWLRSRGWASGGSADG